MARRAGRKGQWLVTDDYTGFTIFSSDAKLDYWGARTKKPLLRNLQEIAYPLEDPAPVPYTRGPSYEDSPVCVGETAPKFVGNTTVHTNQNNAAFQALDLNPSIPNMEVGCTFIVG